MTPDTTSSVRSSHQSTLKPNQFMQYLVIAFFALGLLIKGMIELAFGVAAVYGLYVLIRVRPHFLAREKEVATLFTLWFVLQVASLIWSQDIDASVDDLGTSVHFLLAFPVLAALKTLPSDRSLAFKPQWILFAIFSLAVWVLLAWGLQYATDTKTIKNWLGFGVFDRFEAGAQNPLILALLGSIYSLWILDRFLLRPNLWCGLAIIAGIIAVYATFSRGPLLIFGALMVLILCRASLSAPTRRQLWRWLLLIALITGCFIIYQMETSSRGFSLIFDEISRYINHPNAKGTSVGMRLDMWFSALEAIQNAPWLGYGVGNAQTVASQYFIYELTHTYGHVHNAWLQAMLELGLFGALFLSYLLLRLLWIGWRERPDQTSCGAFTIVVLAYGASGMTNIIFDQGLLNAFFVFTTLYLISTSQQISADYS